MAECTVYEIKGFSLEEADDVYNNRQVGLMSNKEEADKWRNLSPSWRSVKEYNKTIKVFHTLKAFEDNRNAIVIRNALKKLTEEERIALGWENVYLPT